MRPLPLLDVRPPGSDEDALERVRRRVNVRRRRRRASSVLAAAALVVLVGTYALNSGGTERVNVTTGPSSTSTAPRSVTSEVSTTAPPAGGVDLAAVRWEAVAYPVDCGPTTGTRVLDVQLAQPDALQRVALVMVACDAGAGSPPRTILVFDRADSPSTPHLAQILTQDGLDRITSTMTIQGATVATAGGTYSSAAIPRCCPDGEFTARWAWNGTRYSPV